MPVPENEAHRRSDSVRDDCVGTDEELDNLVLRYLAEWPDFEEQRHDTLVANIAGRWLALVLRSKSHPKVEYEISIRLAAGQLVRLDMENVEKSQNLRNLPNHVVSAENRTYGLVRGTSKHFEQDYTAASEDARTVLVAWIVPTFIVPLWKDTVPTLMKFKVNSSEREVEAVELMKKPAYFTQLSVAEKVILMEVILSISRLWVKGDVQSEVLEFCPAMGEENNFRKWMTLAALIGKSVQITRDQIFEKTALNMDVD